MNTPNAQNENLNTVGNRPSGEVAGLLAKLTTLLQRDENSEIRWEIGDLLLQLVIQHKWTYEAIAGVIPNSKRQTLIDYAGTARAFSAPDRRVDASYTLHSLARRAEDKVTREYMLHTGKVIEPNYPDAINYLLEQRKQGESINTSREVTSLLSNRKRASITKDATQIALLNQSRNRALLDRCFNESCVDVIRRLADDSVKLFHFDPPYASYRRTGDGKLDISTTVGFADCENNTAMLADQVTSDAIRTAARKMDQNVGVILLWQASTTMMPKTAQAIWDERLGGIPFKIWDKRRHQPGDFADASQYSTETCYILAKGKALAHDQSLSKDQIIDHIPPLRYDAAKMEKYHQMEKPVELSAYLLEMFTRSEDLVVDGFGCSGSFCRAAIQTGRKWIYCELNPDNFKLGTNNIINYSPEAA